MDELGIYLAERSGAELERLLYYMLYWEDGDVIHGLSLILSVVVSCGTYSAGQLDTALVCMHKKVRKSGA